MDEQEFSQLNVVPLVDVMLVLLTIVLTTSTFIARGVIPLDLPRASRTHAEARQKWTISLDRAGTAFVNGLPVSQLALARQLESLPRSTPVLIRSDRELRLQGFIDVLDLLKGMGFSQVSVQTETVKPGSGPSGNA
ncbi:MAG: biopolymer transporter ExbD [Holophaga sp.]|nr:biopolymer transporter ExbD [Holophaga sp.]